MAFTNHKNSLDMLNASRYNTRMLNKNETQQMTFTYFEGRYGEMVNRLITERAKGGCVTLSLEIEKSDMTLPQKVGFVEWIKSYGYEVDDDFRNPTVYQFLIKWRNKPVDSSK